MDYEKENLSILDTEELACKITGLDYDAIDADVDIIEEALVDKFGIGIGEFVELIEHLIPLVDVGRSPLTKKLYKGFSDQQGVWLTKVLVQ